MQKAKHHALIQPWAILILSTIALVVVAVGAFWLIRSMREPDFYTPKSAVNHIFPVQKTEEETVIPKEPGASALLPGATWVPQTFNNCGPATTSMVLQYFGFEVGQNETKAKLRTNPDDTNVFTYEIAQYLREDFGIESKLLYGGDIELLKKLVANGFYVVVEDWLPQNEDIGHVTIIRGFDDEQGVLIADDSYIGVNITYPYEQFTKTQWKAFNYEYLPVYRPGSEALLRAIVKDVWDENVMYENAARIARNEIAQNENDMYAWFNLGTNLYALGEFAEAKQAFERSQSIGWPRRMLWYQIQPIQTYNALGEYGTALKYADIALLSNDSFAEAHLEKAIAYKGLGNTEKAREEANRAIFYSPEFTKAKEFLASL